MNAIRVKVLNDLQNNGGKNYLKDQESRVKTKNSPIHYNTLEFTISVLVTVHHVRTQLTFPLIVTKEEC